MKKIIHKYRISKFKRFINGLLFAIISIVSLIQCMFHIEQPAPSQTSLLMTFLIATISMILGLYSMFHVGKTRNVT